MPVITPGQIQTNADIYITADNLPPFPHTPHTQWSDLSGSPSQYHGGPNMQWGNHSAGWAITRALLEVQIEKPTLLEATIEIDTRCGGKCGKNGTNTGGYGKSHAEFRTSVGLNAHPTAGGVWTVVVDCSFQGNMGADPPGIAMPPTTVEFFDSANMPVSTLSVDYDGQLDSASRSRCVASGCSSARQPLPPAH